MSTWLITILTYLDMSAREVHPMPRDLCSPGIARACRFASGSTNSDFYEFKNSSNYLICGDLVPCSFVIPCCMNDFKGEVWALHSDVLHVVPRLASATEISAPRISLPYAAVAQAAAGQRPSSCTGIIPLAVTCAAAAALLALTPP